ncbi:Rieske (2Fe-2S) protein [Allopusillimonas ginsengisoli]|uniref:Rieske (2Fe-2S) protein n=1 Tax=Allopusillimonas ginsengisoli TaxID=453575 RepID=UPI003CC88A31
MEATWVEVCAASALVDGGLAVKLPVLHAGVAATAFFVRFEGRAHGYLNRCPHMGAELDWEGSVYTRAGDLLMCARHGATFQPDTGVCVGGPCRSSMLHKLDVFEEVRSNVRMVVWRPSGKTLPAVS